MVRQASRRQLAPWIGRGAVLFGFVAGVIVIMFWLSGRFSPKVPEGALPDAAAGARLAGEPARVLPVTLPLTESAVGSIRAVHEIAVGSKLLARVVEVNIKAGQQVQAGEVLVRLDDTDLQAKLAQAKAAVNSAEAVQVQAAADEERGASLLQSNAISRQEYDRAVAALRTAEAELQRAQQTVKEVQATLDWATIRSPIDGTVIDKKVDAGDMVTPGQLVVTLFDPTRMQLVANVRESLTRQLRVGQKIGVRIEGLDKECGGTVSEIVPEAQASSRAFQVKVTGPCPDGVYSGMFGRIIIPLGAEQVLAIPRLAVQQVGQLELVQVVEGSSVTQRAIRTGRYLGDVEGPDGQPLADQVEVLSGLRSGEQVVAPARVPPAPATEPAPADKPAGAATTLQEATHE